MGKASRDGSALTDEDVYDVLRNSRRRRVLELLRENGDGMECRDLAERIAELESGESPPPRNRRQSVYVSLHQSHLPKLDTLGIVEYDTQSKEVSLADTADEVIGYLESEAPPTGWSTIQFCLGVLGIILVLGADTGVGLLASHPPQNWAYIVLGLMVMSAGIQTVRLGTSLLERSPWT